MIDRKSLCPMCDAWYLPTEANEHRHPQPQSGAPRQHWLDSGMHYGDWVVSTPEGRAWLNADPVRHALYL